MKIPVGFATLLGTIGAAAAIVVTFVGELADAAAPLGVSPKVWVIVSAALAVTVIVGRMAQAVAAIVKQPNEL